MSELIRFLSNHNIPLRKLITDLHISFDFLRKANKIPDRQRLYFNGGNVKKLTSEQMEVQMAKMKDDFEKTQWNLVDETFFEIYIKIRIIPMREMVANEENNNNKFYKFKVALHFNSEDADGILSSYLYRTLSEHYDIASIKIPEKIFHQILDGEKMWLDVIGGDEGEEDEIKFEGIEFEYESGKIYEFEYNEGEEAVKITNKPFERDLLWPKHRLRFFFTNLGPRRRLLTFRCGSANFPENLLEPNKIDMKNKFYNSARVNYEGNVCAGDKYHFELSGGSEGKPIIRSVICPNTSEDGQFMMDYQIEPDHNNIFYCTVQKATRILEMDAVNELPEWMGKNVEFRRTKAAADLKQTLREMQKE